MCLQEADFDSFGFRFPNFGSSSLYILDIFLEGLFPYAEEGDVAMVQYDYYSGSGSTEYGHSIFDGDKWNLTPDVIETSFQYGFENGAWVPDNTINYTLLGADVDLISNAFIDIYPGPADNVGFFGSFDRRECEVQITGVMICYWKQLMYYWVQEILVLKKGKNMF